MAPRVFIIHGWNGHPSNAWFPWLCEELTKQGIEVHIPLMPHPRYPSIKGWVSQIETLVGTCDANTYFVGHSLGAQAILRYLATLPEGTQAGGLVCVGGFKTVGNSIMRKIIAQMVMGSWLRTPLAWEKASRHCSSITALFSPDDTWVTPENIVSFKKDLNAVVRVLPGHGHFTSYEHLIALPEVVTDLLEMAGLPLPDFSSVERTAELPAASRWRILWDIVQRPAV